MKNTNTSPKPIYPIRQKLKISFWGWLVFRFVGVPMMLYLGLSSQPNLFAIMIWQAIWLIPAMISTPFIIKAKSPYALLWISIVMLIYAGCSGFMIFWYGFSQFWLGMIAYIVDFCLLIVINYWLFILLKRLPKMNY